jgi:CRP-like cAMP-binding protein
MCTPAMSAQFSRKMRATRRAAAATAARSTSARAAKGVTRARLSASSSGVRPPRLPAL